MRGSSAGSSPGTRMTVTMRPQFSSAVATSPPAEPKAEQRPLERVLHGVRLIDEYAWLKAENWREVMRDPSQLDPAIRAYLQAENDYCERALAASKSLQETLFAEMKGRGKVQLLAHSETKFSGLYGLGAEFVRDSQGVPTYLLEMRVSGNYRFQRKK